MHDSRFPRIGQSFLILSLCLGAPFLAWARTLDVGAGKTFSSIQAAVDAAKAGDTVRIAPGTYKELVRIQGPAKSRITLEGAGNRTVIDGEGTRWDVVRVQDANDVKIQNVRVRRGRYKLIHVVNSRGVLISDLRVDDPAPTYGESVRARGIEFFRSPKPSVVGCVAVGNHIGIYVNEGSHEATLIGNFVSDNSNRGISVFRANNAQVFGNQVHRNRRTGLHIQYSTGVVVGSNALANSGFGQPSATSYGLVLVGAHNAIITTNAIEDNFGSGVNHIKSNNVNYLFNSICGNGHLARDAGGGIAIFSWPGSTSNSSGVVLKSNTFQNNLPHGLALRTVSGPTVDARSNWWGGESARSRIFQDNSLVLTGPDLQAPDPNAPQKTP